MRSNRSVDATKIGDTEVAYFDPYSNKSKRTGEQLKLPLVVSPIPLSKDSIS